MNRPNPPADAQDLKRRLDDGRAALDEAKGAGITVDGWESVWMELPREYEELVAQLTPSAASGERR